MERPIVVKENQIKVLGVGHAAPICVFDNIDVFGGA